ncbi:MAG TPA: anhydro-N-acetylmuramic acid kinase [Gemmatimonadaceae bacterium]|nr:anhydro-N-acetylmuramic acid kinase [Gemmatimonadaceae bacterium]
MTGARTSTFIGLMSGTSLDGISAAAVEFREAHPRICARLIAHELLPYDDARRDRLLHAMDGGTAREYCRLAADVGEWMADAALAVMRAGGLAPRDVEAIGSHGQTLWHEPGHSTWQIGSPAVIAERTGVGVVSDFRTRDVAAAGQGAPLVPIADAMLFADAHEWRALQNLGGMANVTVVPPGGMSRASVPDGNELAAADVRAFDTGPACAVIDAVTQLVAPGTRFDHDGALAERGTPVESVVDAALAEAYFTAPPPKSTGREQFGPSYARALLERVRAARPNATPADAVATAVALVAGSIAHAYRDFVPHAVRQVILSGGGARNPALVRAITQALAPRTVCRFDELFFDGDAKEAVAFALLALLHRRGVPGNVPAATGARGARILGTWCPA